jgi:hypothetical protein
VAHRPDVRLHQVAVLAGDPVALDDLGRRPGQVGDPRQLPGQRPHPNDRGEPIAERRRIDLGPVATDHALALEALQALGHGGRGESHPPAQLGQAQPGVAL